MKKQSTDQGMVLVAVLLSMGVLFVIVTIVMSQSQLTSRRSENSRLRLKQFYANESAQSQILFKAYRDRNFRNSLQKQNDDEDLYLPDARQRQQDFDEATVYFKIQDANSGMALWDSRKAVQEKENFINSKPDQKEDIDRWFFRLQDYQDKDQVPEGNDGAEYEFYADQGLELLPRDDRIQFIEELLWVPTEDYHPLESVVGENTKILEEVIQLPIPRLRARSIKPSFLSSSLATIQLKSRLTDQELAQVKEAREAYQSEGRLLQESLGVLYPKLGQAFSFKASTYYTIIQEARNRDNLSPLGLRTTLDIQQSLKSSNAQNGFIRYTRRVRY